MASSAGGDLSISSSADTPPGASEATDTSMSQASSTVRAAANMSASSAADASASASISTVQRNSWQAGSALITPGRSATASLTSSALGEHPVTAMAVTATVSSRPPPRRVMAHAYPNAPSPTVFAMLTVRGLSRSYGDALVVDEVSFDVRPGRLTGFVGANGAGKTTTMRMLMGVLAPSGGRGALERCNRSRPSSGAASATCPRSAASTRGCRWSTSSSSWPGCTAWTRLLPPNGPGTCSPTSGSTTAATTCSTSSASATSNACRSRRR